MTQQTLAPPTVKYSLGPYDVVRGDSQQIRITEGCSNQCPYCYEPREFKVFGVPPIVRNKVRIVDMNLLAKPEAHDILRELAAKRVGGRVVRYELNTVRREFEEVGPAQGVARPGLRLLFRQPSVPEHRADPLAHTGIGGFPRALQEAQPARELRHRSGGGRAMKILVKSTPENWAKENDGRKPNTVRKLDGGDVIEITNTETGEVQSHVITDITTWKDDVIISWRPDGPGVHVPVSSSGPESEAKKVRRPAERKTSARRPKAPDARKPRKGLRPCEPHLQRKSSPASGPGAKTLGANIKGSIILDAVRKLGSATLQEIVIEIYGHKCMSDSKEYTRTSAMLNPQPYLRDRKGQPRRGLSVGSKERRSS
jgi:hypothetical protein